MTWYGKVAYGTNPNAGKSPNGASHRGWGSGWPNCQTSKMVKVTNGDHSMVVRREVAELFATLLKITAKLGYDVNPAGEVNQTWGFACRAIAGSQTPSNHSWGLAGDINSLSNPMSSKFQCNIPPAVVHDWEVCGFYWGGRYTQKSDTMHFEFIGTPAEVASYLAKAKAILDSLTPKPQPQTPTSKNKVDLDAVVYAATGGFFHSSQRSAEDDARTVAEWLRDKREYLSEKDVRIWEQLLRAAKESQLTTDWKAAGAQYAGLIKRFQVNQNLVADGIVGPKTREKLLAMLKADNYRVAN